MRRTLLLSGDFFLGGVVAATLAKLVLRLRALGGGSGHTALNRVAAEAMLVGAATLRLGGSKAITHAIDDDSQDRIASALRVRQPPPDVLSHRGLGVGAASQQNLVAAIFGVPQLSFTERNNSVFPRCTR